MHSWLEDESHGKNDKGIQKSIPKDSQFTFDYCVFVQWKNHGRMRKDSSWSLKCSKKYEIDMGVTFLYFIILFYLNN